MIFPCPSPKPSRTCNRKSRRASAQAARLRRLASRPADLSGAAPGDFRGLRAGSPLRLRQLRRSRLHHRQRARPAGAHRAGAGMGADLARCCQLVPGDLGFPHARRPVLWPRKAAGTTCTTSCCTRWRPSCCAFFLQRATGTRWRSALVAFLFALHPLHVESVAWVAERKDVLSACFWFLTLWAYVRYTERPGWGRYLAVALSLCLGLMAKPMVVTLPFVLLLLDYWPLARLRQQLAQSHLGKTSAAGAFGRRRRHHLPGAGTCRRGESSAARNPSGKRDAFLRALYRQDFLADEAGGFLSLSAQLRIIADSRRGVSVGRRHRRRHRAAPPCAVPVDGLGLVRDHACFRSSGWCRWVARPAPTATCTFPWWAF